MTSRRGYSALRRSVGHRGACLLFFGGLDEIYALSMLTTPTAQANSTQQWFAMIAPVSAWAALWAAVGAVCLRFAFRQHDRAGFTAAIGIKVVWGVGSLAGWIIEDVTLGSVAIWLGLAGLVWVIAGWPEAKSLDKRAEP